MNLKLNFRQVVKSATQLDLAITIRRSISYLSKIWTIAVKFRSSSAAVIFSNVGFAKLYNDKTSLAAADFLNQKVLPFFDEQQMRLLRILTDRGLEYCGPLETHKFELFLHLNDIEHTKTKARHPQTNGSVERLNQIIQNEFYAVTFRKKIYTSLAEMQHDLDVFMKHYNEERTNQGKHCKGLTPMETFNDGYELYKKYVIEKTEVTSAVEMQ